MIVAVVFIGWYRRYHGALPSLRSPKPPEIRRAYAAYLGGAAVVGGALAFMIWTVPAAAPVAALVLVSSGVWLYERAYRRATDRMRKRLA